MLSQVGAHPYTIRDVARMLNPNNPNKQTQNLQVLLQIVVHALDVAHRHLEEVIGQFVRS